MADAAFCAAYKSRLPLSLVNWLAWVCLRALKLSLGSDVIDLLARQWMAAPGATAAFLLLALLERCATPRRVAPADVISSQEQRQLVSLSIDRSSATGSCCFVHRQVNDFCSSRQPRYGHATACDSATNSIWCAFAVANCLLISCCHRVFGGVGNFALLNDISVFRLDTQEYEPTLVLSPASAPSEFDCCLLCHSLSVPFA